MVMNAYLRTIRLKRMGFYVRNKIKCAVIHLHNLKLVAMKTYSEFGDSCENIKKKIYSVISKPNQTIDYGMYLISLAIYI